MNDYHRTMQALAQGWNTWDNDSVFSHVLLPDCLRILDEITAERNLSRVAINRLGFDDEAEYLREWRQTQGAIKALTVHVPYDGTFLDFAPYADECDQPPSPLSF